MEDCFIVLRDSVGRLSLLSLWFEIGDIAKCRLSSVIEIRSECLRGMWWQPSPLYFILCVLRY